MNKFFGILLTLCLMIATTTTLKAQRQSNVTSKDTVTISINDIEPFSSVSEKTGNISYKFIYMNRKYITSKKDYERYTNKTSSTKAYIIYNNYATNERKVSKIYIQ